MPKDKAGFDAVYVVIDRLSKQAISMPCYKTVTAEDMAQLYITHVYRLLTGHQSQLFRTEDLNSSSQFLDRILSYIRHQIEAFLLPSTHQTDGQTEIMNQYLDQRLRPYVNYYQDNWSSMLPLIGLLAVDTIPY